MLMTKNNINVKARHKARRLAVQALYQWQFNHTTFEKIEAEFLADEFSKKVDLDYFKELLKGVITEQQAIDDLLKPALDRPLENLTPIELVILRIGVYELKHRLDTPYKVIINESLELTKTFGAEEGYKFVNGVLDKLAKELRKTEM